MLSTTPSLNCGNSSDMSHTFETMTAPGSAFPATLMTTVVYPCPTDDLEILDSLTFLQSYEQDTLLSAFGASSNLSISSDEPSHGLECSDKRNLPSELNYPFSRLHQDFSAAQQGHFLSEIIDNAPKTRQTCKAEAEITEPKWCQQSGKPTDIRMHDGLPHHLRAAELQGSSNLDPPPELNFNSFSDLLKLLDSSDSSDAKEHVDKSEKPSPRKAATSKNLLSERRRREKLNARLYALRAMVPTITKMDRASTVGDTINYVRDLQKQVEEMETDIANLRYGADSPTECIGRPKKQAKHSAAAENAGGSQILQKHQILELEVVPMEEQTYHVRINCKKSPAVLVELTKALEALEIELLNANLISVNEDTLNTFVVKVKNGDALKSAELRKMVLAACLKFGLHL